MLYLLVLYSLFSIIDKNVGYFFYTFYETERVI